MELAILANKFKKTVELGSNNSNSNSAAGNLRKRVRGPTYMRNIWVQTQDDRISILFNEFGQPVDKETTSGLSHFIGSMARSGKYCPIDTPWNKVENTKKQKMLNVMKARFDLPPGFDDWLMKSFVKKMRNWRARIKEDYYDSSLSL